MNSVDTLYNGVNGVTRLTQKEREDFLRSQGQELRNHEPSIIARALVIGEQNGKRMDWMKKNVKGDSLVTKKTPCGKSIRYEKDFTEE